MAEGAEKTEPATPLRRQEARKRGQVAKSADLSSIFVLLGILLALRALIGHAGAVLTTYFDTQYRHLDTVSLSPQAVMALGGDAVLILLRVIGPLAVLGMVLGIAVNMAQTGPMWATENLQPKLDKLNPLTGFTRLISMRGLVELFKNLYKIGLIAYICWVTVRGSYAQLCMMSRLDVMQGAGAVGNLLVLLMMRVASAMLVLAALDYAYQKYQFEKQIRMSKEEVKQEHKRTDGSPQLKARIRARQREIAKKRMMQDVPKADVVITNPTHYAVALQYDPEKMGAPVVVAKGQDLIALKIRELAQMNDVPIVENVTLARALHSQVKVGQEVPGGLYEAVAEVLAFVYQINQKRRERFTAAL